MCLRLLGCLTALAALSNHAARSADQSPSIAGLQIIQVQPASATSPIAPPPDWALWQRQLLDQLYPAALEFVAKYTRPDGTLIWQSSWPGMDGSDDGYESFYNFPLYHALGGPVAIDALSRRLWNAVTRQFTGYGQIYREFDAYYDWMHHGESYTYFYFLGLTDPDDVTQRDRSVRFAGFYLNEDPEALNYDPELKLIRSPINGSRGPRLVNTAEDWVTHREVLANYPLPYDDIPNVKDSSAWVDDNRFPFILQAMNERMMKGDVPLNLTASSLILNAYLYTGTKKYRLWIEEYVSAWLERARQNGGILPDNVGLSGVIGENMEGKWWGGYYGWRWPHGLMNQLESTIIGAANAYLVSGNAEYLALPRSVLELVQRHSRVEGGQVHVPNRHGDRGWYDYRPIQASYPIHLWYLSQEPEDYDRVKRLASPDWDRLRYRKAKGDFGHEGPWLAYLEGNHPDYPREILRATYAEMLRRLSVIRADDSEPNERNVHHWQQRNPVILEGLVQTMLGAPNHIYHGGLLHCRVRYFDPVRRQPGVPPDVAALVDSMTPDAISVQLVNLHVSEARAVILQAGAYGEHQFTKVAVGSMVFDIEQPCFQIQLPAGGLVRVHAQMKRYVNVPSYAAPWNRRPSGR